MADIADWTLLLSLAGMSSQRNPTLAVQGSHQAEVIFEPLTVFWVNSGISLLQNALPGHSSRIWIPREATFQLILSGALPPLCWMAFLPTLPCTFLQQRIPRTVLFRNVFLHFLNGQHRVCSLPPLCPFHLFIYLGFPKTQWAPWVFESVDFSVNLMS